MNQNVPMLPKNISNKTKKLNKKKTCRDILFCSISTEKKNINHYLFSIINYYIKHGVMVVLF